MKLMIVFGTRPELIKLAPVIMEARRRKSNIDLVICSTGQHKEMLDQVMPIFGISPHENIAIMMPNQTLSALTSGLMVQIDKVLTKYKPDIVVVQGDTTTAFVGALASFYQKIPVAHIEAGLRTGDLYSPFPEEVNRLLISRLARWHFAPTKRARDKLSSEGVSDDYIVVTGNTIVDAIEYIKSKWQLTPYAGVMKDLFPGKKIVLITTHRRENFGKALQNICDSIKELSQLNPTLGFVFPVHLNPNVRAVVFGALSNIPNLKLIEPVDFESSLYLQSRACLVLTDSGSIREESPSFGVPCVVMRKSTERHEGVDAGYAQLSGTQPKKIVDISSSLIGLSQKNAIDMADNPYGDGLASVRILDRLQCDFIKLKE